MLETSLSQRNVVRLASVHPIKLPKVLSRGCVVNRGVRLGTVAVFFWFLTIFRDGGAPSGAGPLRALHQGGDQPMGFVVVAGRGVRVGGGGGGGRGAAGCFVYAAAAGVQCGGRPGGSRILFGPWFGFRV
jgi:hypothetical protein